jgi:hypothetical protein
LSKCRRASSKADRIRAAFGQADSLDPGEILEGNISLLLSEQPGHLRGQSSHFLPLDSAPEEHGDQLCIG